MSLKDLQKFRKFDLSAIAQYLNVKLTEGLRKAEILDLVVSHLELKEETQTTDPAQISNQTEIELAKLKFKMEREKMRLEFEEKQKQREAEEHNNKEKQKTKWK